MPEVSLKDRIESDLKQALREGQKTRLTALRLAMAAIKQKELDERLTLNEAQLRSVLEKLFKRYRESVEQFSQAGRMDLVEKEQAEMAWIQAYLPPSLSESELNQWVDAAIQQLQPKGLRAMGQVMQWVQTETIGLGRLDLALLSRCVKEKLSIRGS